VTGGYLCSSSGLPPHGRYCAYYALKSSKSAYLKATWGKVRYGNLEYVEHVNAAVNRKPRETDSGTFQPGMDIST
jgi:hypothetical protein